MHFTLLTFIVNIHTEPSYICFQIMFDYLYTLQSFIIYLVQNTGFLHPLYEQRHAPLSNPRYHHPFYTFPEELKVCTFYSGYLESFPF